VGKAQKVSTNKLVDNNIKSLRSKINYECVSAVLY